MKNLVLVCTLLLFSSSLKSQTAEHKWNVGLHGGFTHYNGDLGNGFYQFEKAFYGHVGLSVNRYLTRHWDATFLFTRGVVGFLGDWNPNPLVPTRFITNLTSFNLLAKYNFFNPEFFMRPYVAIGAGALLQEGTADATFGRRTDVAPELGVGINFHFGRFISLQLQELLMYTSYDNIDFKRGGINDMYLLHTIGLTFNIGKLGRHGAEQTGVGEQIDKCPKIKQHKNKVTKSEGQALRKEKKSKRRAIRKASRTKS